MKKWGRGIVFLLVLLFVGFQFYQPERNYPNPRLVVDSLDFIQSHTGIPENVAQTLKTSCYNCHSNETKYNWYDFIQPARLMIENHIREGRKELNFNEWGSYTDRKKERLLRAMAEEIETKRMPLPSYLWVHKKSKLSSDEVNEMAAWLKKQEP